MKNNPLVSIITPSFNSGKYIEETLLSVKNQTYPNIEHIITDGLSTDNTLGILRKYEGTYNMRWISEADKGQSDAINKGWKMAKGKIVAELDASDTYVLSAIETVVQYFNQYPNTSMIYGNCSNIDEQGKVIGYSGKQFDLKKLVCLENMIPQPAVFMRKEVLSKVGYLDTSLHYAMDYDYWVRIGIRLEIQHIPCLLANFRTHSEAKSSGDRDLFTQDRERTLEKLFSLPDLPITIRAWKPYAYHSLNYRKGKYCYSIGQTKTARAFLLKALSLDPRNQVNLSAIYQLIETFSAGRLILKAKGIWQSEGTVVLVRQSILFLLRSLKAYLLNSRNYYIVETVYNENLNIPLPNTDFSLRMIHTNEELDSLIAEGFDIAPSFDVEKTKRQIDLGMIYSYGFVGKEVVSEHLFGMTKEARREVEKLDFSIDFDNKEISLAGSFTLSEWRGKGINNYMLWQKTLFIGRKGLKGKGSVRKGNDAGLKSHLKVGSKIIGEGTSQRILWWKFWREKPIGLEKTVRVKRKGIKYELDLNELIDRAIYEDSCFEPLTAKAIKKHVNKGMIVLDIGANVGCHTLPMAKLVGRTGIVIAFEPMSWAFEKLRTNIMLNDFSNIILEKTALSNISKRENANFRTSWIKGKQSASVSTKDEETNFITLDEYQRRYKLHRIDFIKIDVDGYEYKIIRGGIETLRRFKPTIIIELGRYTLEEQGDKVENLIDLLAQIGYSFYSEKTFRRYKSRKALLDAVPLKHTINVLCKKE